MSAWRTAGEYRRASQRVPANVHDECVIRYADGTDPDGEPLRRLEVKPGGPQVVSEHERRERDLLNAITAWGLAIRARYPRCTGATECGGGCCLWPGHRPPCLCDGVEGGEEMCPA